MCMGGELDIDGCLCAVYVCTILTIRNCNLFLFCAVLVYSDSPSAHRLSEEHRDRVSGLFPNSHGRREY